MPKITQSEKVEKFEQNTPIFKMVLTPIGIKNGNLVMKEICIPISMILDEEADTTSTNSARNKIPFSRSEKPKPTVCLPPQRGRLSTNTVPIRETRSIFDTNIMANTLPLRFEESGTKSQASESGTDH